MSTVAHTDEDAGTIVRQNQEFTIFEWGPQQGRSLLAVDRAKGVYFWDTTGKRYLDFSSQAINVNLGHADDRVIAAMKVQLEKLPYISPFMATEARGRLGQQLAMITPGTLSKAFFTLGGAEANENAIRVAFIVTGRRKVLSRYRSYHGATTTTLSLSGDARRWPAEPGLPGVVRFWGPYPYRCRWCGGTGECTTECLNQLEDVIIHEGPHTIAALILEPIPGGYGVIVPPDGYLRGIRNLCSRYGILLIADEVMTGFGRTGEWFAVNSEDVQPDIMTISKGLTSGHAPLGVCMLSSEIADLFQTTPFPGGLTFNSYALGCAAASATIEAFMEDELVENSRRLGLVLLERLEQLQQKHQAVGQVRGRGLFAAIELVRNRETREPFGSFEEELPYQRVMHRIRAQLLADGLFASVRGSVIMIAPPLCIDKEQLADGLEIIDRALDVADREVEND